MEDLSFKQSDFTLSMLQKAQKNWLHEQVISFIKEACDWIEKKLPSLRDFDEKLAVVELYTSSKLVEFENSNLKSLNQSLNGNREKLHDLFEQQKTLFDKQSALLNTLHETNGMQNERIKTLQALLKSDALGNLN